MDFLRKYLLCNLLKASLACDKLALNRNIIPKKVNRKRVLNCYTVVRFEKCFTL